MSGAASAILERVKDLLWPRTCAVRDCGRRCDRPGRYICSRCYEALPWHDEFPKSALAYLDPVPELVGDYKFHGATDLTEDFADALVAAFRKKHVASEVDVVVPVPLHPARLRERGYNQAQLLAEAFAGRINRVCDVSALVRVRNTKHQSRCSGDERLDNVKGAFRVEAPSRIRGRTIVLVDDVMTTGATTEECVSALTAGGAFRVVPFVLAKALMDEDVDGKVV